MKKILIILPLLLIVGCAPTTDFNMSVQNQLQNHTQTILVRDNSYSTISNAQVIVQKLTTSFLADGKPDTLYTDSLGVINRIVTPTKEKVTYEKYDELSELWWSLRGGDLSDVFKLSNYVDKYSMTKINHYICTVTVSKDGYRMHSEYKVNSKIKKGDTGLKYSIVLTKNTDYFSEEFLKADNKILNDKILNFIDVLLLQSFVQSTLMVKRQPILGLVIIEPTVKMNLFSIKLDLFKENKYLTLNFEHLSKFNTLALNKYEIGKYVYDEVIRQILSPLNEYTYSPNDFWGYNLSITVKAENFMKKSLLDSQVPRINYRFLIPAETVKSYKNLDITGQDVLDASYILMDGERIKLQLQ